MPNGVGARTDGVGDFSIGRNYSSTATIPGGPGLVLYQAAERNGDTPANENVTFTFSRPVQSVTFTIFDLTREANSSEATRYIDKVAFDVTGTLTRSGDIGTGSALTSVRGSGTAATQNTLGDITNFIYRSGQFPTIANATTSQQRNASVTLDLAGSTMFTMAYSGDTPQGTPTSPTQVWRNRQWIIIGDMTVCF